MDSTTRERLQSFTLWARQALMDETRNLLVGTYGLAKTGVFESVTRLPALQASVEAKATRRRLEQFVRDEKAAGLDGPAAVDKLVKETAFTHLNRLVAFKLLETRRVIRGTIDRWHESNAFKYYLADEAEDLARYERGDLPKDELDEGPRDIAYRHFLVWQCRQLAQEITVLFDPDNLPSALFPRPRVLREVINRLNDPALAAAWQPGNEETIGWVYQDFVQEEKAAIFAGFERGQRARAADIPPATQLFTPRWIVQALVHNSLGQLWLDMHPDSRLRAELGSRVPIATVASAPLRPAREITLLDPACGTMHFGLIAFDLFAAMYREEIDRVGEPGWPAEPSVATPDEIPAAIIAHNLFGIDLDLRAVQLSALTLYLKAKALNRQARLTDHNLARADIALLNGARLDAFLAHARFSQPIYMRLVRGLWGRLQHAEYLGSLLRPEADLADLIATERQKFEAAQLSPKFPGFASEQFETDAGRDEFWTLIEEQIIQAFDAFAREQAAQGRDEQFFTGEAVKGLRLLRLLNRRYDVVATNPPYLSTRNMSDVLRDGLKTAYPQGKGDLYAAFIARCAELLAPDGRLAMIVQQSFMFISSYDGLRKSLRDQIAVETMIHVGPRAFAEISGEKVNTTVMVLRRETDRAKRDASVGAYLRLVREPDAEAKRRGFEAAVTALRAGGNQPSAVFHYRQGDFDAISGSPWVYWITPGLRRLFTTGSSLGDLAQPRMGVATRNNTRFLRFWWEVGLHHVKRDCESVASPEVFRHRWFPYMKGGAFRRWCGNQTYIVNYWRAGNELKEEQIQKYPYLGGNTGWIVPNEEFYFRRGVTFPKVTSGSFSARLSPGGFIFDVAGSSIFPDDVSFVLAVLNSEFAAYALKLINPTVNFQVGDLARLPIPSQSGPILNDLVEAAIGLARADSAEDETTYDFVAPPDWTTGLDERAARRRRLTEVERAIDEEVYRLYAISAEDRAAIEAELGLPASAETEVEVAAGDETPEAGADDAEAEAAAGDLTRPALAELWLSYAVGIVLGRFQPGEVTGLGAGRFAPEVAHDLRQLIDADGLAPVEPGHADDLAARARRVLELALGEAEAEAVIAAATGGKALADYLTGDFFKEHVKRYRKRPIYWLFQSPKRRYSIYVFHERATADTLDLIRHPRYLGGKRNATRQRLTELQAAKAKADRATLRRIEREIDDLATLLSDLDEFDRRLAATTKATNERGDEVGWRPELDDGVLINLAPLRELLPGWSKEPAVCWQALTKGEYDWSRTARRYWPDRVAAACQRNRSYAIAHGLAGASGGD